MRNPIETIEKNGKIAKIFYDDMAEHPREMFDHLDVMVFFHKRYGLGDKTSYKSSHYGSWDELKEKLIEDYDDPYILPVYLYDHSSLTISTTPFSCPWDSGQIGFVLIKKDVVAKELVAKEGKTLKDAAYDYLKASIGEYDMYLRGEVYGYEIEDENGDILDSCWGFYGMDYIRQEIDSYLTAREELDTFEKDMVGIAG